MEDVDLAAQEPNDEVLMDIAELDLEALSLFMSPPGIEILPTDCPDWVLEGGEALSFDASQNHGQGEPQPAPELAEDELIDDDVIALFLAEAEGEEQRWQAEEAAISAASTEPALNSRHVSVKHASTGTVPRRQIYDCRSRVLTAPHSQQHLLREWQQRRIEMFNYQWRFMVPYIPAPVMLPQNWTIAAQLPVLTPGQFMWAGPQLSVFPQQVPLLPLQYPMLLPVNASIPRPVLPHPPIVLPDRAPGTVTVQIGRFKRRLHHILWTDDYKYENPRKSSTLLERAAKKWTKGMCAFTINQPFGSEWYRVVLGRNWSLVVLYLETKEENLKLWKKSLTILKHICLTVRIPYPTVVALCMPHNAARYASTVQELVANKLIASAGMYPVNATQLSQFLDHFLPRRLQSATTTKALAMKLKVSHDIPAHILQKTQRASASSASVQPNSSTVVQQAVTAFAALGNQVIAHRPARREPVYFAGPGYRAPHHSAMMCSQPSYMLVAMGAYRTRREVPIRPKPSKKRPRLQKIILNKPMPKSGDKDTSIATSSQQVAVAPTSATSSSPLFSLTSSAQAPTLNARKRRKYQRPPRPPANNAAAGSAVDPGIIAAAGIVAAAGVGTAGAAGIAAVDGIAATETDGAAAPALSAKASRSATAPGKRKRSAGKRKTRATLRSKSTSSQTTLLPAPAPTASTTAGSSAQSDETSFGVEDPAFTELLLSFDFEFAGTSPEQNQDTVNV